MLNAKAVRQAHCEAYAMGQLERLQGYLADKKQPTPLGPP
jgi:hypothetical protein